MANNQHPERNLTREARSKGGQNSSGNFKFDRQRAAEAGRKGGMASRSKNDTETNTSETI